MDQTPEFDRGDTAFMIVSAALVILMTPGLAFFYGGLVSSRTTVTIMFQSFISMGLTSILWWAYGYSLAFSGDVANGFIGNLKQAFTYSMDSHTPFAANPRIPEQVFYVYQLAFAMVTPALITGAFHGRVRVKAYLIFLVLWLTFVYVPWAHWVWGGGWAAQWGILDFAGGVVVHTTAGMSALASVFFVGSRKNRTTTVHSLPLVAIGTGLLWFGWFGFNAGSQLTVDGVTGAAFFNTALGGATGGTVWFTIEWIHTKKPHLLGFLTGVVAGLATITPAAGFVYPWAAFAIGFAAGVVCYFAVQLRQKLKWDDALDVWGVHGVGGALGTILLGCLATKKINPIVVDDGLFYGNGRLFGKEVAAVALASVHGFLFTFGFLWIINKITPVRLKEEQQQQNTDMIELGEATYADEDSKEPAVSDIATKKKADMRRGDTIPEFRHAEKKAIKDKKKKDKEKEKEKDSEKEDKDKKKKDKKKKHKKGKKVKIDLESDSDSSSSSSSSSSSTDV